MNKLDLSMLVLTFWTLWLCGVLRLVHVAESDAASIAEKGTQGTKLDES